MAQAADTPLYYDHKKGCLSELKQPIYVQIYPESADLYISRRLFRGQHNGVDEDGA